MVPVCLALLRPSAADANHENIGGIEFAGVEVNSLHIGRFANGNVDYRMLNLRINDPAAAGFSFNTGIATWLNQPGITVEDTSSEQGFSLLDENAPITLPIGDDPAGIPRGYELGELIPFGFRNPIFLNQQTTISYAVVGTPGTQIGRFVETVIPEPSSFALAGLACVLLGFLGRCRELTSN